MLKIIGYLGIGGLSFFIYFTAAIVFNFQFHILKELQFTLQIFLYIWYFYFFFIGFLILLKLNKTYLKVIGSVFFIISLLAVLLLSLLIFGNGALGIGQYKFVKSCKGYDIVRKFVPWSEMYFKYQNNEYIVLNDESKYSKIICDENL